MLRLGDVTKEILITTGIPTPLGEVVIMRARSAGYVQLAGPSITTQLRRCLKAFLRWGPEVHHSMARWAANAWGPGTWRRASSCVPVRAITSMEKVIADTAHIYRLMNLPKAETLPPEAPDGLEACVREHGAALVTGALTDTMVVPLLRSGVLREGRLVVKDPSKVLLSADTLDKLAVREVALETKDAAKTLCVTVNPVSAYGWKFDKDEFFPDESGGGGTGHQCEGGTA